MGLHRGPAFVLTQSAWCFRASSHLLYVVECVNVLVGPALVPVDMIFLHCQSLDYPSSQMIAVMLWLASEDDSGDISLYFNCPGGEVKASPLFLFLSPLCLSPSTSLVSFPISLSLCLSHEHF